MLLRRSGSSASAFLYSPMASLRRPSASKMWARARARADFSDRGIAPARHQQGLRSAALLVVELRAAVIRLGKTRIEFESVGVLGEGAIVLPLAHIDEDEVAVGAPLIDHAAIEINDRVVWFEARLKSASALSKSFIG